MTPRAQLIASSAAAAALLVVAACAIVAWAAKVQWSAWPPEAFAVLSVVPAAAIAAAIAARSIAAWREGVDLKRQWSPLGMAFKIVVLAFLIFPVFVVAFLLVAEGVQQAAGDTGSFAEAWRWMPSIAVYSLVYGVLLGSLPALAAATIFCRRYLRRTATGTATQ